MRLIDADALPKIKFHPLPYTQIVPSDADAELYKRGWNDAVDAIVKCTDTIDPVKHGKWIGGDGNYGRKLFRCSLCDESMVIPTQMGKPTFDYCPNCGAIMERSEE